VATGDAGQFEALARRFLGPEVLSGRHVDHVAAQYPTGSLARITPEMIAAAQAARGRPRISNFVGGGLADAGRAGGPRL
jgi:glutamate racemase